MVELGHFYARVLFMQCKVSESSTSHINTCLCHIIVSSRHTCIFAMHGTLERIHVKLNFSQECFAVYV